MSRRRAPSAVLTTVVVTAATLTASTVAHAATTTFTPVADTYVDNGSTGTNYGTSGQLGIDNSPVKRTFLKFTVSGISGAVGNAKLRIHTDDVFDAQSPNGGTFRSMSNVSWTETGVTWNNQPAIDGATLGSLGAVVRNAWYEIDVTSYVTGNGTFSIGVTSSNSDGAD